MSPLVSNVRHIAEPYTEVADQVPGVVAKQQVRSVATGLLPLRAVGVAVLAAVAGGQHPHPGSEFRGNIDDVDPVGA